MPLNDPSAPSTQRQPRPQLLIAGKLVPGLVEASVTQVSHHQADRWSAEVAWYARDADGKPADVSWMDWQPATNGQELAAEIRVDPGDGTGIVSLLIGRVDHIEADPITGTIHLEGRDRTADLIETKTFTTYKNQTASEIATTIATEHGLTPVVTATKTPAGRYYQADHDKVTLGQFSRATTEWDLLCELAEFEGFDVFVQGTELQQGVLAGRTGPEQ